MNRWDDLTDAAHWARYAATIRRPATTPRAATTSAAQRRLEPHRRAATAAEVSEFIRNLNRAAAGGIIT